MIKGLKKIVKFDSDMVLMSGVAIFFLSILLTRPIISRVSKDMENTALNVSKLF